MVCQKLDKPLSDSAGCPEYCYRSSRIVYTLALHCLLLLPVREQSKRPRKSPWSWSPPDVRSDGTERQTVERIIMPASVPKESKQDPAFSSRRRARRAASMRGIVHGRPSAPKRGLRSSLSCIEAGPVYDERAMTATKSFAERIGTTDAVCVSFVAVSSMMMQPSTLS